MAHYPFRAGLEILLVLGLGRDTGKSKIFAKFGDKAFLVRFQVIENSLHVA